MQQKYKVIYIDCPHQYKDKCHSGDRGVEYKYPTMSLKELSSLPIGDIADKDCFLFFWITCPLLPNAFELFKSWGNFQFKTVAFNWIKQNKKNTNTLFWSMGSYTRANSELCLLATKGKPKVISHSVHQIIQHPVMEHSQKPPIIRDKIVELCGDVPRIEIFAREQAPGWVSIGNAIDGLDINLALNNIKNGI